MTPEEFRSAGHQLIDWIADYRSSIEQRPVRAQIEPGDVRRAFSQLAPESPPGAAQLLADLEQKIVPGITQVQHPMHYGWFPSNASLASTLGDIASSGLGCLGISWEPNWRKSSATGCASSPDYPIAGRAASRIQHRLPA
jgi:aromatic-L-amino-acid decarboxylase